MNPEEDNVPGPMPTSSRSAAKMSRRSVLSTGLAAGAGVLLGGRGRAATAARRAGSSEPPGDTPAFPLTMDHIYGTTTISAPPQRVVTAGFNDADFALAVGVVPVGVANFIGSFPEEDRRWALDALGGAEPEIVTNDAGELLLERIAALEPDVIVYYSYLQDADYADLSAIAPTIAEPAPGTLWQRHTIDVGRALGFEDEARARVTEVEQRFTDEREAHPEFVGTTAALVFGVGTGTDYYLLEPADPRVGLFVTLGFEMPETTGEISAENVALLDQDVIVVIGTEQAEMEADPLFSSLAAVRDGRVAYLGGFEDEFAGALGFDSPLSLPIALDIAVPELARALDASS